MGLENMTLRTGMTFTPTLFLCPVDHFSLGVRCESAWRFGARLATAPEYGIGFRTGGTFAVFANLIAPGTGPAPPVACTRIKPDEDVTIPASGAWQQIGASTYFECIDEGIDDPDADNTYIYLLPDTLAPDEGIVFGLEDGTDPELHIEHVLYVRARLRPPPGGVTGGDPIATETPDLTLTMSLLEGATVRASFTTDFLEQPYKTYFYELSEPEAAAITDYTDLAIKFVVNAVSAEDEVGNALPFGAEVRITAADMGLPCAPAPTVYGTASGGFGLARGGVLIGGLG